MCENLSLVATEDERDYPSSESEEEDGDEWAEQEGGTKVQVFIPLKCVKSCYRFKSNTLIKINGYLVVRFFQLYNSNIITEWIVENFIIIVLPVLLIVYNKV